MPIPATIVVPRDLPVNADIPGSAVTQIAPSDGSVGVRCTFTGSETVPALFTNYQGGSSNGNNATPIGNTGVGYRLQSNSTGSIYVTGTKNLASAAFTSPQVCATPPCYLVMGPSLTMTLVKLQQTLNNPTLPSGKYMDVTINGLLASTVSLGYPVQIISQTCSVTTPSIQVNLGSVPSKLFTSVGTGSTAANFNITADCSGLPSTNLGITFTDAANPSNQTNTLPLSSTSTASGVGIQIMYNGTAVSYGPDSSVKGTTNQIMIGQVNGTMVTIPLAARYVQTASSVHGGTANGTATFTMSYQ
ncbi:fimbrial protein [Paraburkholderia diazotrophica]|uniref:fimbrial protein n=1 Tax=Paraburkholderia diazotrophica TaxID=667676 RepID=UPI00316D4C7C